MFVDPKIWILQIYETLYTVPAGCVKLIPMVKDSFRPQSNIQKCHCVKSVKFGVILVHIQCESRKIRTRITPNTDTFHAVCDYYLTSCGFAIQIPKLSDT